MRSRLLAAGFAAALVAALAIGCGKSVTAPTPLNDSGQVSATLASSATLVDDGLAEDTTSASAAAASLRPASVQATVRPFTWWQRITSETRTWTLAFADTDSTGHPRACVATLTKHLTGFLVVVPQSPSDSTQPDTTVITKPLDKTLTRKVLLWHLTIGDVRVWKVVAITGAAVTTPAAVTHIQSVRLHSSSGVDTTITDPLQWNSLRHVIRFGTNDTVTVTVTTLRTDDVVYIHRWDWRHRLHNNLDTTYSWTWVTSAWPGWRHMGLQAMSNGSLYDDSARFDMQAWHIPFRVSQPDVDYYP